MLDESRTLENLAKFFLRYLSQLYCSMYFWTAKASFWKPLFSLFKDSQDCVTMHVLYYDITITLVQQSIKFLLFSLKRKLCFYQQKKMISFKQKKNKLHLASFKRPISAQVPVTGSILCKSRIKGLKTCFFHFSSMLISCY